jgi:hypothetical protein
MKPQTVYSKVKKYLEGCAFLTANFDNVPEVPFADLEQHLPSYRYVAPVTSANAPRLAGVFDAVCERLKVPRDYVHGFVVPSPKCGACCRHDIKGHAVIEVKSGTMGQLTAEELVQVIGHEIGHFILPVQPDRLSDGRPASWEDAKISRHAELAMDRIGLVASRDIHAACRMLLKFHVGLPDNEYKYDVEAFLAETAVGFTVPAGEIDACAQHPHLPLRIRALLLFSQSDYYLKTIGKTGGLPISDVNASIAAELDAVVDAYADAAITEALTGVGSCLFALVAAIGAMALLPEVAASGLTVDLSKAKAMATRWSEMSEDEWVAAYKSDLSVHLQSAALKCPRTLNQRLAALSERFTATEMEDKLQEVREVFAQMVSGMDS